MHWIFTVAVGLFFAAAQPAAAQVAEGDNALIEQLLAESFKLEASAIVTKVNYRTSVSYSLVNNSAMNLWMGIAMGSVAIGSCSEARSARGGLMLLPVSNTMTYGIDASGPPRPVFVPAGGKIAGLIAVEECEAPNPGSPSAQFSMSLMMSKTNAIKGMVPYPVSAEAKIRVSN